MRSLLAALVLLMAMAPASAAIVMTALEVRGDVVVTAVGSVDTTGMVGTSNVPVYHFGFGAHITAKTDAGAGVIFDFTEFQNPNVLGHADRYLFNASGPATIGTKYGDVFPNYRAGSNFSFLYEPGYVASLFLPVGYESGAILGSAMVFSGATFNSLGFTRGSYVWNMPADTLTFNVGPEIIPPPPAPHR